MNVNDEKLKWNHIGLDNSNWDNDNVYLGIP